MEIDGVSGRSNFSSYDQWSDYSRPATSNSIANKENVASHQSAAIPNSAKRNGSTPFSTDLLARYVLSKPQPAKSIPRSPLAKQQQGKKPPKRLDADSDDSFEDQDSNEKGPLSLTNATKGDPPPPVSTATTSKRQSNRKSTKTSQPEHERVETEEHDEDSVILISPLKSTAPSARAVASYPSTSCSKAPSARQLSRERNVSPSPVRQPIAKLHPEQMTPFEIVPPTPSAVRKSRSVKVKSSSRRSAALRVRPINESLTSSKSAATSGKKQPPPAPKRPSAPDAIIIDEVPDSEMEAVKPRKSKTTSRPPAKRKAPSIETDSVDDDWLPQQIRPTVPANPFYASTPHKPAPPASSSRIVPHAESDRHPTPVKSLHVQHDQEPKTPSQGGIKRSNLKVAPAIQPLLQACGQAAAYDFSSFIDQTAQPNDSCSDVKMSWKKLGEATYSEIFVRVHNCDDAPKSRQLYDDDVMVVKVVPIHLPKPRRSKKKVSQSDEEERPEETSVEDALRELTVTRLMNEDDPGGSFISLLGLVYFSLRELSTIQALIAFVFTEDTSFRVSTLSVSCENGRRSKILNQSKPSIIAQVRMDSYSLWIDHSWAMAQMPLTSNNISSFCVSHMEAWTWRLSSSDLGPMQRVLYGK